jgi:hypothetical protein
VDWLVFAVRGMHVCDDIDCAALAQASHAVAARVQSVGEAETSGSTRRENHCLALPAVLNVLQVSLLRLVVSALAGSLCQ